MNNYNWLVDIAWPDATRYHSREKTVYNSKQYNGDIVSFNFSWNGCRRGIYEATNAEISLLDGTGEIREVLANPDYKSVYGISFIIRKADGTQIIELFLYEHSYGDKIVNITAADRFQEMERKGYINSSYKITKSQFPNRPDSSEGKMYSYMCGEFRAPSATEKGKNAIWAYRTENKNGGDGEYVVGVAGNGITYTKQYCTLSDDTDISANCTLRLTSGIYYIDYTGNDEEYIKVNLSMSATKTAQQIITIIGTDFFPNLTFTGDADIRGKLLTDEWHITPITSLMATARSIHYALSELMDGRGILQDIGQSLNIDYSLNSSGDIKFSAIDYDNLGTPDMVIQENEAKKFRLTANGDLNAEVLNVLVANYGYEFWGSSYHNASKFRNSESLENFGYEVSKEKNYKIFPKGDESTLPLNSAAVHIISKREIIERENAKRERTFDVPLSIAIDSEPFDVWKFSHYSLENDADHTMRIHRLNFSNNDIVSIDFEDLTTLANLDVNMVFLLQSDAEYDNDPTFFDKSVATNGNNFLMEMGGNVVHDTSDSKYTDSSILFTKTNSEYLVFGSSARHHSFDLYEYTNFIVCGWFKFPTLGAVELMVGQWQDQANNYWWLGKNAADKFRFAYVIGGVTKFTVQSDYVLADNDWHFMAGVKVGLDIGIYVDGNQTAYIAGGAAPGTTLNSGLQIAWDGAYAYSDMRVGMIGIWTDIYGWDATDGFAPNAAYDPGLPATWDVKIAPTGIIGHFKSTFTKS